MNSKSLIATVATGHCLRLGVIVAYAGVGVFAATTSLSANEPEFHYEPAACKRDAHNKIFIALGENVFAFPQPGVGIVFGPIYPGTNITRLRPPDPAQPEGCPDNPLQLQSYTYNYAFAEALARKWGMEPAATPRSDLITIGAIRGPAAQSVSDATASDESFELQLVRTLCAQASIRETLANGLEACRIKPIHDTPVRDWGAAYSAPPQIYSTPFGNPFVFSCDPGLTSDTIGHCDVQYTLFVGVAISYRFQPFLTSHAIPINHILDFDRSLRAELKASLLADFKWPSQRSIDGAH